MSSFIPKKPPVPGVGMPRDRTGVPTLKRSSSSAGLSQENVAKKVPSTPSTRALSASVSHPSASASKDLSSTIAAERERRGYTSQIAQLQKALARAETDKARVEATVKELEKRNEKLEKDRKLLLEKDASKKEKDDAEMHELIASQKRLQESLIHTQKTLTSVQEENATLSEESRNLRAQQRKLVDEIKQMEENAECCEERLLEVEGELNQLHKDHKHKVDDLERQIEDLQSEMYETDTPSYKDNGEEFNLKAVIGKALLGQFRSQSEGPIPGPSGISAEDREKLRRRSMGEYVPSSVASVSDPNEIQIDVEEGDKTPTKGPSTSESTDVKTLHRKIAFLQHQLQASGECSVSQFTELQENHIAQLRALAMNNMESAKQLAAAQDEIEKLKEELKQEQAKPRGLQDESVGDVIRSELQRQVGHLKSLEATNGRLQRELNAYKESATNIELLKVEKKSLETKVAAITALKQTLNAKDDELATLKREKSEWTAFLSNTSRQHANLTSPHAIAKALASTQIALASAEDRVHSLSVELKSRDGIVKDLEERVSELADDVDAGAAEKQSRREKQEMVERETKLLKREIEMLREQLKSYETEEAVFTTAEANDDKFSAAKTQQITHYEELLNQHKLEMSHLKKECDRLRGMLEKDGGFTMVLESGASPKKSGKLTELIEKNESLQQQLSDAENANALLEMDLESLNAQIDKLNHALGRGEYNTATTQILELADNPASQDFAIRTEMLEGLKKENEDLLQRVSRLQDDVTRYRRSSAGIPQGEPMQIDAQAENSVPKQTFVNLQKEAEKLAIELKNEQKSRQRLSEVFGAKAREMREAVRELLGFKLELQTDGRIKVYSVLSGSSHSLVFAPSNIPTTALPAHGPPRSTYKLIGSGSAEGEKVMETEWMKTNLRFWVAERNFLPGFMSSLTLEAYEVSTRGKTSGFVNAD